jgi:hypothetical protein
MGDGIRINGAKYREAPQRIVDRALARRLITSEGCWLYPKRNRQGYGWIRYTENGVSYPVAVHRLIYTKYIGDPGDDKQLDHVCHNPDVCTPGPSCPHRACFNPDHLEPVTAGVNGRRSGSRHGRNSRKTHCDYGHEFTPENTRVYRGMRRCKKCGARREAARRAAMSPEEHAAYRAALNAAHKRKERFCRMCGTDISMRGTRAVYCAECSGPARRARRAERAKGKPPLT